MKLFRLLSAIVWAVPFYFLWNHLAPIYAPELPEQYLNLPFWHVAGVFALIQIVMIVLSPRRGHFHGGWGCHGRWGKYARFGQRRFFTERYYHRS